MFTECFLRSELYVRYLIIQLSYILEREAQEVLTLGPYAVFPRNVAVNGPMAPWLVMEESGLTHVISRFFQIPSLALSMYNILSFPWKMSSRKGLSQLLGVLPSNSLHRLALRLASVKRAASLEFSVPTWATSSDRWRLWYKELGPFNLMKGKSNGAFRPQNFLWDQKGFKGLAFRCHFSQGQILLPISTDVEPKGAP